MHKKQLKVKCEAFLENASDTLMRLRNILYPHMFVSRLILKQKKKKMT